jgi:hypothetical protein
MWAKHNFFYRIRKTLTVLTNGCHLSLYLNSLTQKNRSSSLHNGGLVEIVFITVHTVKNKPFEVLLPF